MTSALRLVFLVATPVTLAVVLWWHPPGGDDVFADLRHDVNAWLNVHTTFLVFIPLLGLAAFLLLLLVATPGDASASSWSSTPRMR